MINSRTVHAGGNDAYGVETYTFTVTPRETYYRAAAGQVARLDET